MSLSPTLTLSDSNTPDSLLARSPDHSCTFSHSHYTPTLYHTQTHTLILFHSSHLLTVTIHVSLAVAKLQAPTKIFLRPIKAFTVALTDTPLCRSSLFFAYDSLFMALLCPCLHLSVHLFFCFDSIFLFDQTHSLFTLLIPPILQRRCNYWCNTKIRCGFDPVTFSMLLLKWRWCRFVLLLITKAL